MFSCYNLFSSEFIYLNQMYRDILVYCVTEVMLKNKWKILNKLCQSYNCPRSANKVQNERDWGVVFPVDLIVCMYTSQHLKWIKPFSCLKTNTCSCEVNELFDPLQMLTSVHSYKKRFIGVLHMKRRVLYSTPKNLVCLKSSIMTRKNPFGTKVLYRLLFLHILHYSATF